MAEDKVQSSYNNKTLKESERYDRAVISLQTDCKRLYKYTDPTRNGQHTSEKSWINRNRPIQ
jgi:hypothetical protein